MRFLIIDNYDSFVYNIAQYLGELGVESTVIRNDKITLDEIKNSNYDAIIISPGPGTPEDKKYFGVCSDVIKQLGESTPILGVCLGHQGIIDAFGGKVTNAGCVRHGKTSPVSYVESELFEGVSNPFRATRYHSLVGDKTIIPDVLQVIATASDDGEIMAIKTQRSFNPRSAVSSRINNDSGRQKNTWKFHKAGKG